MKKTAFGITCVMALVGLLTPALATEQIYHPVNPVLGGNPNNGPALLSAAQSQGEGAKSGNQGPDLTPLADALKGNGGNGNGGTGTGTGSGTGSGSGSGGGSGGLQQNLVANPLAAPSGRF